MPWAFQRVRHLHGHEDRQHHVEDARHRCDGESVPKTHARCAGLSLLSWRRAPPRWRHWGGAVPALRVGSMGTRIACDCAGMRRVIISVLLAAGCSASSRDADHGDAAGPVFDGATDVVPLCSPAEYDAGLDAALPAWALGFFFADPPTGASDAFDLRVGPGPEFELTVTGCDEIGTTRGGARVDDAGVWLLPAPGESTLGWPTEVSLEPVPDVLLAPGPNGRGASASGASIPSSSSISSALSPPPTPIMW